MFQFIFFASHFRLKFILCAVVTEMLLMWLMFMLIPWLYQERQGQCKFGKVSKISKMHPSLSGEQFKVNFGNIVHNVANFLKNSSE